MGNPASKFIKVCTRIWFIQDYKRTAHCECNSSVCHQQLHRVSKKTVPVLFIE